MPNMPNMHTLSKMRDTLLVNVCTSARVNRTVNTGQMYTNFVYYNHKQKLPLSFAPQERKGSPITTITVVNLIIPAISKTFNLYIQ
jgi:hypothetical protein